ncbi:regulator of G-protein signaling 21-like [Erpetoichthys calabaricus]|uniref:Regulator of G protein signaling 13b n=1 Tax=Erpetoichthys calabaricus TaxID=27687 RepID=A0A8C4SH08_ERPCA|nr:regulator of G-protein signaling 21-like [Erpetoichthys calabaricus]
MPGLLFPSAVLKESDLNSMEKTDRKKAKNLGKDFICRLQSIFPSPAPTADSSKLSKLNTEEALLWSQSLEKLLQSKYGLPVFQTFLRSEFSEENIEFWLTCEDFKKIKSTSKQASRAKKIYEQFIQAESPREINIDHHTREAIRLNVQEPTMSCFDQAQKIVYGLMERDSYPRFLRSEIYLTLSGKIQPNQVKG